MAIGIDLNPFFNQYLRDTRIPTLEYFLKENALQFRWTNCVKGFNMPVRIFLNGDEKWLQPNTEWTIDSISIKNPQLKIDPNFYVGEFDISN
jgi:hypothetical protein